MDFVIGEKIRQKVEERGVTQKAFANAIGMTSRNLERFFERKDISINQLVKASEFLNFDFVTLFLKNHSSGKKLPIIVNETSVQSNHNQLDLISIQLNIKGDVNNISKNLPELIKKVKKEAENFGFFLG